MEDGQLFHSLSDVVDLSFQGLTLEGLIAFFEEAPTGEWRFVSRINAPDTANAAPGLDRLTGHFDSASHDPNSIREVLDWFASQYGICVDANNGTKIVAFVNCRQ